MRSSPEARRMVTLSAAATGFFVARTLILCFLLCVTWFSICPVPVFAQAGLQQISVQQTPTS
ncbi:MAG: hypothetical protein WA899_05740, partial [Candidatus Sulfotelmatobacter sp.]